MNTNLFWVPAYAGVTSEQTWGNVNFNKVEGNAMKDVSKCKCNTNYTVVFCTAIIMWLVINTVFMRFVNYDSQTSYLDPAHYNIEVITQEDYGLLADVEKKTVTLSSGKIFTKWDTWGPDMMTKYKPVDDSSQYVAVTLRGTAAFVRQWYSFALPVLSMCCVGIFYGVRYNRQQKREEAGQGKG